MPKAIQIDGSQGEGGGQIVRSSLALSMLTGKSVQITNIRAGRKKPGLKQQHLTALRAAQTVSNATVEGDSVGSATLSFQPETVQPGDYYFKVGTAGSATLVLQTVLPALMLAEIPSSVTIEGGTHNQWAPPFDFLQRAYIPLLGKLGPKVELTLHAPGFFPAGQGKFTAEITPATQLRAFNLLERGREKSRRVEALVANLPETIARREIETATRLLKWPANCGKSITVKSAGPGNIVLITLEYQHATEVISSCGRQGLPAEKVARIAVREAQEYLKADSPVGQHLADQILLLLGIAADQGESSRFRTLTLTQHSLTHIDVLQTFLEIDIQVEPIEESNEVIVTLQSASS